MVLQVLPALIFFATAYTPASWDNNEGAQMMRVAVSADATIEVTKSDPRNNFFGTLDCSNCINANQDGSVPGAAAVTATAFSERQPAAGDDDGDGAAAGASEKSADEITSCCTQSGSGRKPSDDPPQCSQILPPSLIAKINMPYITDTWTLRSNLTCSHNFNSMIASLSRCDPCKPLNALGAEFHGAGMTCKSSNANEPMRCYPTLPEASQLLCNPSLSAVDPNGATNESVYYPNDHYGGWQYFPADLQIGWPICEKR